ncbi:uncharacterized protein LOC125676863 [Ostrea edulis]|uniref:uncharacterized protein LOC125676863 n=1 Tax=Ostrea edulis TaxID=37623 RepID=UPI002094C2D3|nr:uncharacterized protein LOC125676863 [Ostrea edulis]XP_048770692.1 uncharacterized protein LOC125676863 [Ostrea edulis]
MYLSQPKTRSKPVKSAPPIFGTITRSPRTPVSSSLYSESDDGGTPVIYHSEDTSVNESASQGGDQPKKGSLRRIQIGLENNDITETIQTERPTTGRTVKSLNERVITEIETCISEYDSEKIITVTEKLPSLSETKSSQSFYSNTFESDEKSHVRSSKSDQESTRSGYMYSDTFHSMEPTVGEHYSSERDSTFYDTESDRSDHCTTGTEESETHSSTFKSLEETVASTSPTPESYTLTFEDELELEREYSADFEDYDYTDTFLPTESLENLEKIRKADELKKIGQEAEENFVSAMITHIKQQPMRDTDISALIDKELEGTDHEDLDKHSKRFINKKIQQLKQRIKRGGQDQKHGEETNKWESKETRCISNYGVHPAILDKLRLYNFINDMEKAAQTKIHDPKMCRECRAHHLSLDVAAAERNFIRLKTREIRQREMEDNYHKHLVKMDSINLIADIARSLPRPTEDPKTIEDMLFRGLDLSKAIRNSRLPAT